MRLFPLFLIPLAVTVSGHCAPGCSPASETAPSPKMLIDRYVSDPALHRSWGVIVDCDHPDWPPHLVEVRRLEVRPAGAVSGAMLGKQGKTEQIPQSDTGAPAVQSGSRVELWSDGAPRIRLSGIALESAPLGKSIHVRAGLGAVPLRGVVRGPHSVELEFSKTVRSEP